MRERKRISINSEPEWKQQGKDAANKSVYADIVGNTNTIQYNSLKEALKAVNNQYAEKAEKNRQSAEPNLAEKQRKQELRQVEERIDVRNKILQQEKKLGIEGTLSKEDIKRAENSNSMVGREDPLKVTKRDVKGLEGKTTRKNRSSGKLLPSERRDRLSRAKIERSKKKELEKTAKKELYITDAHGNKISVEKLRKLRGLNKNQAVTRQDTDFAKKHQMAKRKEQENLRIAQERMRKRDDRSR